MSSPFLAWRSVPSHAEIHPEGYWTDTSRRIVHGAGYCPREPSSVSDMRSSPASARDVAFLGLIAAFDLKSFLALASRQLLPEQGRHPLALFEAIQFELLVG